MAEKVKIGIKKRVKKWRALKKAKKEEKKHIPTQEEIEEQEKEFTEEGMSLKPFILKKE